jgi:hypothetical protein
VSKKRKAKKRDPHDTPLLSAEEKAVLNSLLKDLTTINRNNIDEQIPSPRLAQVLVEKLPPDNAENVDLILAIRDAFDQKAVQKAIKKTIFKFKQRGISVPDSEPQKDTRVVITKTTSVEPSAYLGPIDRMGSRGIFLILPQIPKGVNLGMGIVNDEDGILQFLFGGYSKKRMREVKDLFFARFHHMVDVSLSHAATVLERSYSQNESASRESHHEYLQLRPWILENITLLEQAAIYESIPLEGFSKEILTSSQIDKLFGHELMKSWIIDPDTINPLAEELVKVEESPIHISDGQKTNRINEIKEKGIKQLFPDSKRLILKNRLEEMALVFLKLDEEDYARLSLAGALTLDEKDSLLGTNPLLLDMVERSLDYREEWTSDIAGSEVDKKESSSRIILPGSSS